MSLGMWSVALRDKTCATYNIPGDILKHMLNNRVTVKQSAQVFRYEILIWIQWDPLSFLVQNTQFIECVLIRQFAQKVKYNYPKPKNLPFLSIFLIVAHEKKLKSLWGSGWVLQFYIIDLVGDLHGVLEGDTTMFEDNARVPSLGSGY